MIVIADTSVILNLCFLQHEHLLTALFGIVHVPTKVAQEFERLALVEDRFHGLVFPVFIKQHAPTHILPSLEQASRLQDGEVAALSLAVEMGADAVLMDERAGCSAAAQLGLKTTGLLGILIEAKSSGLISQLAPLLNRLHTEARFWVSPALREKVLRLANEKP